MECDVVGGIHQACFFVKYKASNSITYLGCTFCKKRLISGGVCIYCHQESPRLKPYYRVDIKVEDRTCSLDALAWESARDLFRMTTAEFVVLESQGKHNLVFNSLVGKYCVFTFLVARSKEGLYIRIDSAEPFAENARDYVLSGACESGKDSESTTKGEFSFTHRHVEDPITVDSKRSQISVDSPPSELNSERPPISRDFYFGLSIGFSLGAFCCCIVGMFIALTLHQG